MRGYIVPHTHWDREWYATFQQFRFKLVRLVDRVLETLETDPSFKYFTLDGQAVILEDYLEIKPAERGRLEKLIAAGRLLIGPWYVLPDEFLVSGEALIRNLLRGADLCRAFGGLMAVGYVPDQFGHIAQLPQILTGFRIDAAVLWRGVSGDCRKDRFRWEAPDGSRVNAFYLSDSYSNAAGLPATAAELAERIEQLVKAQHGRLSTDAILLMNGSDHLMPQPGLPGILPEAAARLKMALEISSLPRYIAAVRQEAAALQPITGELRSGERAPLLTSCASSRIRQKQRNHAVETLLEKYAEPLAVWAWLQGASYPAGFLAESWRQLLLNHPHDSICGCGNDQVHREIETRFDHAEQVARLVRDDSLRFLAQKVDTGWFAGESGLLAFNPHPRPVTGLVEVELPETGRDDVINGLVDEKGRFAAWQPSGGGASEYFAINLTPLQARAALGWVGSREIQGLYLNGVKMSGPCDGLLKVDFILGGSPVGELDLDELKRQALALFKDRSIKRIRVVARQGGERGLFIAAAVPGCGWRSYEPLFDPAARPATDLRVSAKGMESSLYRIKFNRDGSLDILDKESGLEFMNCGRLVDGGDRGDLYTYAAPERDRLVGRPRPRCTGRRVKVEVIERGPVRTAVRLIMAYRLPAALTPDRQGRLRQKVSCAAVTTVSLAAGLPGIHFRTEFENRACDHRLRVHFTAPLRAASVWVDGHFNVAERPLQPPPGDYAGWAEKPNGLAPQKSFISIDDGRFGVTVVNQGLPEYEVIPAAGGRAAELAVTLLRGVGWLSREDLPNRPGHAGPAVETPGGQCPGAHSFAYSLVPHRGDWQAAGIKELAGILTAPLLGAALGKAKGELPAAGAMLSLEPRQIVLSSVKQSQDGRAVIIRIFNCSGAVQEAALTPGFAFKTVRPVNLLEEPAGEPLPAAGGRVRLSVPPWRISTLRFES
ncbi:MAG: glycosyl hydrolase-related protein [Bacillota bacterium]